MGSAPVKIGVKEQCPERERLVREWTQCGRRLVKLLDDQLAAMKSHAPSFAKFEEKFCWPGRQKPKGVANTSAM